MATNQSISSSYIFLLNECLPSFYNEFVVAQYYKDESTNLTTISFEYFNNNNCLGRPIFNKKWTGIPPFESHIPFMSPSSFNTTDPQNFLIDVKQTVSVPINSVIVQLYPAKPGDNGCDLGVYGYAVFAANSSTSANGETSYFSCIDGVPQSKTCSVEGCDQPLIVNQCLLSSDISILGFCSNSTLFPFN